MNGKEYKQPLKSEHKLQAETFFKVMLKKKYSVPDIADILGHMGKMLLEHANSVAGK